MKIYIKKITMVLVAIVFMFFAFSTVYAATDYVLLAPLPGVTTEQNCTGTTCGANLTTYLAGAFNLSIGIAAALAFIVITYGGFLYATSDALMGKAEGKKYIEDGIYGLLLVIASWIILATINPQILNFNLIFKSPTITSAPQTNVLAGGDVLPGYKLSAADVAMNDQIKKDLKDNYHVSVPNGPCTDGGIKGCTNLLGMPNATYTGLFNLTKDCGGCNIIITGGTEGGHQSHGPGIPTLDIKKDPGANGLDQFIDNYMKSRNLKKQTTKWGDISSVKLSNGQVVQFLDEPSSAPGSTGDHWHVIF